MRASYRERPPWLARVGDIGAGVLVAPDLVLTCSHVVPHDAVDVTLVHAGVTVAASVEFRDDELRLLALPDHGEPRELVPSRDWFPIASRIALYAWTGDGLTPWAGAVRPDTKTTTALRGGQAFVALGDGNGGLGVWSCPPGGRARVLAAIDLDSPVTDLIWHPDGTLVVWCRSGAFKLDFG